MADKITFSEAVASQLPYLTGERYALNRRRFEASGICDEHGKPTEFVGFLDSLYKPFLEDADFFWGQPELFRKIAAGKFIWEARRRFPVLQAFMPQVCAIGAIIANGTIHRRACMDDLQPFFDLPLLWSDLLDEAAQLIVAARDLERIAVGKKNDELAFQGIHPREFRTARTQWSWLCKAVGADSQSFDISADPLLDTHAQLRCAIVAGTLWTNTFDRYSLLQSISVCSVLSKSRFNIQGYGPNDLVVVGWNFPAASADSAWDMTSEGYPLTMVTKMELEEHTPDLLEHPDVMRQLAGIGPPAQQRVA